MNKTYRLIWNDFTHTWVAVAEIAKARGKRASGAVLLAAAGFIALPPAPVFAAPPNPPVATQLPTGGKLVAGQASIAQSAATLTVTQSSNRAAIDWQTFNVGSAARVNFIQPSSSAAILNRVLDPNPSQIFGRITANGQVFLTNSSGIYFSPTANVNVGALTATTHSISNDDFMAGRLNFSRNGATGKVENEGSLTADLNGYIALLAPEVRNSGVIVAQLGTVVLAAGEAYELQFDNNRLTNIRVEPATIAALVDNGNAVQAPGGLIILSAQAANRLQGGVVNNSGSLEATGLVDNGGVIRLEASDRIIYSGSIKVDAAANSAGKGGTATLIASLANPDSVTEIGGSISARGGDLGGDGGFIETSAAHLNIADSARVTTAAALGLSGSWLLDPVDFTIAATGGDMTGAALTLALDPTTGSNVSISAGDANVNDVVSWSANKLTLNAYNNININAVMNGSGTASLALLYGQGSTDGGVSTYKVNAAVNLPAGNNFSTKLGSGGAVKAYTVITSLGAAGSITTTDLQGINGGLALNYVLGGNIDATATSTWNSGAGFTPIVGATTYQSMGWPPVTITQAQYDALGMMDQWDYMQRPGAHFSGTFDGLGHTVSNLSINRSTESNVGLFGNTDAGAVIRNVGLVGGSVTGSGWVGGLVGMNSGSISNSYATANVEGDLNLGGLVGANYGSISNSYTTGKVTGSRGNVGGLVGTNWSGSISNSYTTGKVTGSGDVGGLVGFGYHGSISNSYATGKVTGNDQVGGLVGLNMDGTISNSFYDKNTSGLSQGIGSVVDVAGQVSGLSTAEMQTAANFTGFTFTTTPGATGNNWVIVNADGSLNSLGTSGGGTTPMLASEYSTSISNAHQLQLMAMAPAASYTLGANINAAATGLIGGVMTDVWGSAGFVPVGNSDTTFTGIFDGLGHTVSNLTINRPATANVGLFGAVGGASIRNVGLVGGSVTGGTYVGGLVGYGHPGISIRNSYSEGSVTGINYVGGLVGLNYGMISNSHFTGTVTGTNKVGGLVGHNYGGSSSISNSYATGAVTGASGVGGLVGVNDFSISDSYAEVAVTGTTQVGGLVGSNQGSISSISNSYATGLVSGNSDNTGGLVGGNAGSISDSYATGIVTGVVSVGGLVGRNSGSISDSYATGSVTGSSDVGGLVGLNDTSISNSFWDVTTSGKADGLGVGNYSGVAGVAGIPQVGVTGLATADMKLQASFTPAGTGAGQWDFTTPVWKLVNNGYPCLAWSAACVSSSTPIYLDLTAGSSVYGTAPVFSFFYNSLADGTGTTYAAGTVGAGGTAGTIGAPTAISNVQSTRVTPTLGSVTVSSSYTISAGNSVNWLVTRASATVTGNSASKTYNGLTQSASGFTATGLVNSETASVLTGVSASGAGTTTGTYAVTPSGSDGNYSLSFVDGSLVIGKAAATVTGNSASKTYNGLTQSASGFTATGLVNGETASVLTGVSASGAGTNAGTYAVTPSGSDGNYSLSFVNGSLVIDKAALTVTAGNASKSYGQTPTLTAFSSTGLQNAETIGSVTESSAGSAATASVSGGPYAITPGGATGGSFNAGNYSISYANGSLTVTPAALTVTAGNASKSYGQTPTLSAFSSTGLQNAETIGSVTETSAGRAATASVSGGPYTITPGSATGGSFDAGNYSIGYANGSLTVTPAALTVTAGNASKSYDGLAYTGGNGVVYAGFVNNETGSLLGGTLAYAGSSQGATNASSYILTPNGLTAGSNYSLTFIDGSLVINKAHLTVTADDKSRIVGLANPALTATLSGFVNGENLASAGVGGSAGLATNADATTPASMTAIVAAQGTLLAKNYDFTLFRNGVLTINNLVLPFVITPLVDLPLPGATPQDNADVVATVDPDVTGVNSGLSSSDVMIEDTDDALAKRLGVLPSWSRYR